MNQKQRDFLIKKIEEDIKNRIRDLDEARPEEPSLESYLTADILSGQYKLNTLKAIAEDIVSRSLEGQEIFDWDHRRRRRSASKDERTVFCKVSADVLFIVPVGYKEAKEKYDKETSRIDSEIEKLRIQKDTLMTRIQLASDKVLQSLINEVDDMGDLRLVQTTLKQLSS